MHRIDTSTAQIDKFGAGKNGFTNGDPATGRRATDLNSDMWDAVQEEICSVIEKSGFVLKKEQHDQLYLAIINIITSKIPDALLRNNNLSDVVNKAIALSNLGGVPDTRKVNNKALTQDITIAAGDVGAYPVTGGEVKGEVWSGTANNYRIVAGNKGAFWRFDGNAFYLMLTKDGDPLGGWNDLRPFIVTASNGNVEIGTSLKVGGNFTCANTVYSGNGASWMATDGNIYGGIWGGYLSNWVNSQIANVNNYINGNFVRDFRLGGLESTNVANAIGYTDQPPYVITGVYNFNSDNIIDVLYRRPMQKYVNGTWYNVGSA